MKKFYLLITALCITALTGCIKEEYSLEETAITVNVSTRATGTQSNEQGDGIQDVNVWAFKYTEGENGALNVTDTATAWSRVPALTAWSSVDVHLQFQACTTTEKYILVAVINQGQFGTITANGSTLTLGRNTTYSQLTAAKFVAPDALMGSNPGNGSGADPDYMPISHWTTFELTTNNCLVVPMPVYRALAKTQLLVAKSDENAEVTIKNVTLGSSAYPTEGALLSASEGTTNSDDSAGDFAAPGDATPQWYVSDVTKSTTAVTKDIFSAESSTVSKVVAETTHGTDAAKFENYDYLTSYFLYENKGGSDTWNVPSSNGGYYMDVTYDAGAGDKTERVWLPAVVRNHDIQVRALVNAGGKMTLTFVVQPWTDVQTNWNYTDVVTLTDEGKLKWTTGSYEKIETDGETKVSKVIMKKTNDGYATLGCTFKIDTPVGATWHASFVGGDINSFEFMGASSGPVGTDATLQIKAASNSISESQMAYLDIVIRTADGRTLKSDELTNNVRYQLVQNP